MKTILVPTDFSTYAEAGVKIASQIAERTGSPIVFLHNVHSMVNWDGISEAERQKHSNIQMKTAKSERNLSQLITHEIDCELTVHTMVTHGITHNEIVSKAEQLSADLIVMGSHGDEGPNHFFIGSTIQKVIRFASCPVLATKSGIKKKIQKIVFPSQFDFDVHKPFGEVLKLAEALGSSIYLLYVNTQSQFKDTSTIKAQMNEFCSHYPDWEFKTSVHDNRDIVTGILDYSEEINADMIALITRDRRHSAKYLVGITEQLVIQSGIPVLSVNEKPFESVIE